MPKKVRLKLRELESRGADSRMVLTKYTEENREIFDELNENTAGVHYYDLEPEFALAVFDREEAMVNVLNSETGERMSVFFKVPAWRRRWRSTLKRYGKTLYRWKTRS